MDYKTLPLNWATIPEELLVIVMSYLNAKELMRIAQVSYHWRCVAEENCLWRPLFLKDFKLSDHCKLKICSRWIDEYKMFKFNVPNELSENLPDCYEGMSYVCFSKDGLLFCTVACNASFKIWTTTHPVYLFHERHLDEELDWEQAFFAEFSPDNKHLLISGLKYDGTGEIAVFSIDVDADAVNFSCRVRNSPPEFQTSWINNSYIFAGEIFHLNPRSVIGSSVSQLWICSAKSFYECNDAAIFSALFRLLNRGGGFCQKVTVGRYISSRLRGVIMLAQEAAKENKSLLVKSNEIIRDASIGDEEKRNEMKKKIDLLSQQQLSNCSSCNENHRHESDFQFFCCNCYCHEENDRLLIYASSETSTLPPHCISFKIIHGTKVLRKLYSDTRAYDNNEESEAENGADRDQLSSIIAMIDLPDHIIDLKAHIMGFSMSEDHRQLLVNITHDNYLHNPEYNFIAEIRVINLSTMTFGSSYFGHFATITDRFQCSIGGPFVVSGSKDGGRIWSKDYKCVIGNLSHGFDHGITAAVQPIDGSMIVTVSKGDDSIKIWRSKKFLQKEIVVPNDFM